MALYLEPDDLALLKARIDWDPELAWINRAGEHWIARRILEGPLLRQTVIWHIPGGRLPLVGPGQRPGQSVQRGWVTDPFAGWEDLYQGRFDDPVLGDPTCVFRLRLCVRDGPGSVPAQVQVGISTLGWIGAHYGVIGSVPAASTTKNWDRLRKWVAGNSVRIKRVGELEITRPSRTDAFAFPAALAEIRAGAPRMVNPRYR